MTDITPDLRPAQIESLQFRSPTSENALQQLGALCNGILNRQLRRLVYLVDGTWDVPNFVTHALIFGCGGGGGGGAGSGSTVGAPYFWGAGGAGGMGAIPGMALIPITPLTTYNITIGLGGVGGQSAGNGGLNTTQRGDGTYSGQNGGVSVFSLLGTYLASFYGAPGGQCGAGGSVSPGFGPGLSYGNIWTPWGGNSSNGQGGNPSVNARGSGGENSIYALGGSRGDPGVGGDAFNEGGGGGASYGPGAKGGRSFLSGTQGSDAAANSGAGGGGGCGINTTYGLIGGDGGSGRIEIYYFGLL